MAPVRIAGENSLGPGPSANRMYSHTVTVKYSVWLLGFFSSLSTARKFQTSIFFGLHSILSLIELREMFTSNPEPVRICRLNQQDPMRDCQKSDLSSQDLDIFCNLSTSRVCGGAS